MEKKTASSLFVNDGSFMERFKQLQQEQESKSEPTLSGPTKSKPDISNSGSKGINKSSTGKLAFSLKQKSKLVAPAVKLSEDEDENGPIKRQKVDRFDVSEQPLKQVVAVPSDPIVKKAADNLATFVAKNGRQIEHITRQKNPGDTPFNFLFDESCADYKYYEYRLAEEEKILGKSVDSQIANTVGSKAAATNGSQRSHQQHPNYQTPASALFDATESAQSDHGEATAPSASDPIAMMEFYMKKAAQEEKKRRPKHSKDEMPPPASLQGDGKRGHHMGDYIPLEELDKFMASCNDAAAQKAAKEAAQRAIGSKAAATNGSQRSHQQHPNYQTPASALFDATESAQSDHGEATAPSASDPIAMMEFYMKKAAQEEKKRRPKHSKDEMPPPASLQGDGKRGHHMGDYIPLEELDKFMASCNDAAAQKAAKEAAQRARIQADNVGHKLLSKMGWKEGEGLGSSRSGIADPIMAGNVKKDNLGVGASQPGEVTPDDDIYEQYKKRMMLGYKHRPNPLGNPRKAYY